LGVDWILLLGRILYAVPFIMAGLLFHIGKRQMAVEYARGQGAPMPEITVPGTGVVIAGAGALLILGVWADLMALILAVTVATFAIFMHAFWKLEGYEAQNQQNHFTKNMQIAGGGLALFFLYKEFGEGIGLNLTDPLFS
jgi:uncharacterized membrane protein YphA (DoxX/SURF4 family)